MSDNSPKSFEQQVNDTVANMTQDASGKWQLPEGVQDNEALAYAANAERRRRDTQSSYTKVSQQLKQTTAERDRFAQGWEADFSKTLPADAQADLEELKATDPEAWRSRLNELEQEQRNAFQAKRTEIQAQAVSETEEEYRIRALAEFTEANPTLKLTDDVIENDIPPRITRELKEGKVDFGTFLQNCAEYLNKGRVMKQEDEAPNLTNLANAPGSSAPGGDAVAAAAKNDYNNEIY